MTIFGRRSAGSSQGGKQDRAHRRKDFQRRALFGEFLEPRAMMDGTGFNFQRSPYWNVNGPADVNADGRVSTFDALAIINDLNLRGARHLATPVAGPSAGEGTASGGMFIDVNNDNRVTAMDALQVINRLNSAGEGDPMMRLTVQIVAAGTNNELTSINQGGFYEMRILTEDLGVLSYMGENRTATFPNGDPFLGVVSTFFDVLFDTSKTAVQTNESQIVLITGTPTTNGTFTLTVNDGGTLKTSAPITFASNRSSTATNIQDALNTLLKPDILSPDVVEVVHEPSGSNNRWRVRFLNKLGSQDVPEMTGNVAGLGTATLSITEDIKGLPSNPVAYSDALILRTRYDSDGNPLNDDGTPPFFESQRSGSPAAFGIDDLGASSLLATLDSRLPGPAPTEIARIRMNAVDAGVVTFGLDPVNIGDGLEHGVNGFFSNEVTTDLILLVGDTLTITAPLSAGDDSANTTEGSTTPIDIVVTTNDVNNAPTPNTTKSIVSINTAGLVGTATILNSTTIRYTPPGGDVNGPQTFTYTVTDQNNNTDTATVTINIAPVNDAPVVTGPNSQNINEDTVRIFNLVNGNQITLNDVDNPTGSMALTVGVTGGGALTLGSTAGLTGTTGNGTSSITTNGTLSQLNAALEGLSYISASNTPGTFTLTVTLNDNGQTPAPALQGSKAITLNVAAVNDAPVVELGGFTIVPNVVEGDPLVLNAANNTLIQVSDVDSPTLTVTLAVAAGNTLHVNPTAGVTIGTNDTNSVTLDGSVANLNAALASGVTFTAALGAASTDTLQISVNDGTAPTVSASRTIQIDPATRPRARNDALTVTEDSVAGAANTVDVLYGPTPDIVNTGATAELLSFDVTSVNGGTITRDENSTPGDLSDDKLIYVPAPDFFGTDSFTYTMNDDSGLGADSIGTVNVTVTSINDTPVPQDDTLSSVAEDSGVRTILASELTGNDSRGAANESAQTLTIASVTAVAGGTVSINGSGNVVFTPTSDFNGTASFTYTVQDNGTTNGAADPKTSGPATVSFTITEVNDAPTVPNQPLANVAEDTASVTIPFATLLTGATAGAANEGSQTLTISAVSAPVGGTVAISGTDVVFSPTANFNGNASFTFTVTDNGTTNGANDPKSTNGTASFTITADNDAPVAQNDTATTGEAQATDIAVRNNDFDVDVAPFTGVLGQLQPGTTIVNISTPTDGITNVGTAVVQGSGIRFTPNVGFFGTASFTYQLNDGSGSPNALSAPATVTVTVVEANDPPVANPDPGIVVDEDGTVSINVFGNDTDPDTANTLWSFVLVTPPANGSAVFNTTTRQVDYTPAGDYNGPDSFVYQINDNSPINPQSLLSGTALVSITVREVNDAPVGGTDPDSTGGRFTVIKDRDRTFTIASLLANDSPGTPANEAGQTINITAVSPASTAGGTVTLSGSDIVYVPLAGYVGNDSFTYTLTDNGTTAGSADPKSVQVTVNIIVRDFIPTDINGFVYRDVNNNGVFDPNEFPLAGVEVTLSGTSDVTGAITPITVETRADGFYEFLAVEPGSYTITEVTPLGLSDGKDTAGLAASLSATNDQINLILPLLGVTGGVSTNNFGEGGVDANQLINAQGLVSESLSSSSPNGFVLATSLAGVAHWNWSLDNWDGAAWMTVTLDTDKTAATLVVSDGVNNHTIRIFQNPYDSRNPNRTNPDVQARLARFRILGWDAAGNHIIRFDGKATDLFGAGTPLAAAPLSAGEYVDGVDAAMMEETWA